MKIISKILKNNIIYMYKYFIFVIFGILLYLFYNNYDNFSIGIPEYLLTINDGNIKINLSDYSDPEAWARNENGPLSPSNPVIMVDENKYYVYGDDSVSDIEGINDAHRNYINITYGESMQSGGDGGGATEINDSCATSSTELLKFLSTKEVLESKFSYTFSTALITQENFRLYDVNKNATMMSESDNRSLKSIYKNSGNSRNSFALYNKWI